MKAIKIIITAIAIKTTYIFSARIAKNSVIPFELVAAFSISDLAAFSISSLAFDSTTPLALSRSWFFSSF